MAAEKKVFDVGKPGSAKPETGSKPMVVGHKSLMADPDIKVDGESDTEESKTEEQEKKLEKSKIVLQPISAEEKEDKPEEKSPDKKSETEGEKEEPEENAPKPEEPVKDEPAEDTSKVDEIQEIEKEKKEKEKLEDEKLQESTERLEAMIKSKEYFVPIKEASGTGTKSFLTTVVIILLVGLVAIVVLMDAEILDLGVNLPFDFI